MTRSVRPGTLDDLAEIARLHAECFADGWGLEFLGRVLAQPGSFSAIATDEGRPAGFVIARAHAGEAEIISLGVHPTSRRRSLGTALVRSAIDQAFQVGAEEVFLEVGVKNAGARELYGRLGFREVGRRPAYYGSGVDALTLRYSSRD
ncbi:MAG TPA: GNAT family N-acetyltransferase [Rhizomicrobium sp.]|nr:GNAT family N-acetyltransferase [Rhizomicrobium sp.]